MRLSLCAGEFAVTVVQYISRIFRPDELLLAINTLGLIKQEREQGTIHLYPCRPCSPKCKYNSELF